MKNIFQQAEQHKDKLKAEKILTETDEENWNFVVKGDLNDNSENDDLDEMTTKLKKVFRLIVKNLTRIEVFNNAKTHFIKVIFLHLRQVYNKKGIRK